MDIKISTILEIQKVEERVNSLLRTLILDRKCEIDTIRTGIAHIEQSWKIFDDGVFYGKFILLLEEYRILKRNVDQSVKIGTERTEQLQFQTPVMLESSSPRKKNTPLIHMMRTKRK